MLKCLIDAQVDLVYHSLESDQFSFILAENLQFLAKYTPDLSNLVSMCVAPLTRMETEEDITRSCTKINNLLIIPYEVYLCLQEFTRQLLLARLREELSVLTCMDMIVYLKGMVDLGMKESTEYKKLRQAMLMDQNLNDNFE